ncbi:hypothetical protein NliqN6_3461 [Naganishia liquefaciens]|uniref:COP9 signalosome complex subunit 3 n=1 Tax=Naganishia liquefaciens TaxID=104408 RepID=A0A8H3TU21_9TREE|nr:hypothetical protein NliqN6_3461 [Naganishia liquefaciens]
MSPHTPFPAAVPSLPSHQTPRSIPALREFIDDPASPFNVALNGGVDPGGLMGKWMVPVLERLVRDGQAAREVLGGGWDKGGGRGKEVVVLWALATYFTDPVTPETHPADLVHLANANIRTIDPAMLRNHSITAKLGDLSNGILAAAKLHGIVDHTLQPLWTLLHKTRGASSVTLTPIHAPFIEACLLVRNLDVAMTLLEIPITDVASCPLKYMDYLAYHYLGAQVYIALQQWKRAREMLRAVVCAPGTSVSAVQIAAHKRLVLVNLIIDGTEPTYPRFLPGNLLGAFNTHASDYTDVARAYTTSNEGRLGDVLRKSDGFRRDGTYGLLLCAYEVLPAHKLLKIRETYVRISLGELARRISGAFGDVSEDEAEALVMQLVKQGTLSARIVHPSQGPATIEFTDDPEPYNSPTTVDTLGVRAMEMQEMSRMLGGMEQALSVHESWLKEVIRRDEKRPGEGKAVDVPSKGDGKGNVRGVGSNWADAGF